MRRLVIPWLLCAAYLAAFGVSASGQVFPPVNVPPPAAVAAVVPVAAIEGDSGVRAGGCIDLDGSASVADPPDAMAWSWAGTGPAPAMRVTFDVNRRPAYLTVKKVSPGVYRFKLKVKAGADSDADVWEITVPIPSPTPGPAPLPNTDPVKPTPPPNPAPSSPPRYLTLVTAWPPLLNNVQVINDRTPDGLDLPGAVQGLGLTYRLSPVGSQDYASRSLGAITSLGSDSVPDGSAMVPPFLIVQAAADASGRAAKLFAGPVPAATPGNSGLSLILARLKALGAGGK